MPGNRKLHSNVGVSSSSDSSADKIEDALRWLKIDSREDKNGDAGSVAGDAGPYPDRPGEPDCIYYLRTGNCGYGSSCRFNHPPDGGQGVQNTGELPERIGQPDCGYYLKTGTCKYGSTCKYHHPKDRHGDSLVVFNILGLPMRKDAKPCPYYMQTGLCKYGYACKFHHPPPMSTANVVPVAGPTVYGSGGSVLVPSSSVPSVAERPESSLLRATYVPSPLQVPQSFMPIVLSPAQGWNAYMGSINPASLTGVVGLQVSNGQPSASHLPERPDQPECRYFMNNGNCKYGSDCKYHHPREKVMQLAPNYLGPLGLPLRPGQPVCVYYSLYGLCKYGPTCKFDHPLEGFSYTYSSAAPSPSIIDSPWVPHQKTLSLMPLSETSSSRSSKFTYWDRIKKGTASHRNGHSNIKQAGDMSGRSDSLPRSSKPSSEFMNNDESD